MHTILTVTGHSGLKQCLPFMLSYNSSQTMGNIIRTFKWIFEMFIMLIMNSFELRLKVIGELFLYKSFISNYACYRKIHSKRSVFRKFFIKMLLLSDNSFPKALLVIKEAVKPFQKLAIPLHKTLKTIHNVVRESILISS